MRIAIALLGLALFAGTPAFAQMPEPADPQIKQEEKSAVDVRPCLSYDKIQPVLEAFAEGVVSVSESNSGIVHTARNRDAEKAEIASWLVARMFESGEYRMVLHQSQCSEPYPF